MSAIAERPRGKLGGRISLTAWKLRQDRLKQDDVTNTPLPIEPTAEALGRAEHLFDPWLATTSNTADALARAFESNHQQLLETHLSTAGTRKRKMRAKDRENLRAALSATWANLIYAIACGYDPPAVAVSLRSAKRKTTRYDRKGFAILPKVLEAVAAIQDQHEGNTKPLAYQQSFGPYGWTLHKSRQRGLASTIVARPALVWVVKRMGIKPSSFRQIAGAETILLIRTERDHVQGTRTRELIDYAEPEGAVSRRFRDEMEAINTALAGANIGVEADGGQPVPTGKRRLQRFFSFLDGDDEHSPRFDQGGRLFGGWWQELPKARRNAIRISGEPVADLDFANMFLRLAYLEAGKTPPDGDLYARTRLLSDPRWRKGVKLVANAMFFRNSPLTRLPRDKDARENLPENVTGPEVREAILAAHPDLAEVFETGVGFKLMFVESQVLVSALLKLIALDVIALPMHDGLLVPKSKHGLAAQAMGDAAEEITGYRLPTVLKSMF